MIALERWGSTLPTPTVVASTLPAPLASSRLRGWRGLTVEHYRADRLDVELLCPTILVTVHLGAAVSLVQMRDRQTGRRRIGQGDTIVTPPGEPKRWQAREPAECVAMWLAPELIERVAAELEDPRPDRVEILDNFGAPDHLIEHVGMSLLAELEHEELGASLYVEAIAIQLATHLLRRYSRAGRVARLVAGTLSSSKLRRVTEYVSENLSRDLTLAELAQAAAMSPYHFARVFKQTTGVAPHQYLIGRRIALAKSLLRETELPITDIAHRVGCSNQSHFSTLFHRATAMTPRAFRQRI